MQRTEVQQEQSEPVSESKTDGYHKIICYESTIPHFDIRTFLARRDRNTLPRKLEAEQFIEDCVHIIDRHAKVIFENPNHPTEGKKDGKLTIEFRFKILLQSEEDEEDTEYKDIERMEVGLRDLVIDPESNLRKSQVLGPFLKGDSYKPASGRDYTGYHKKPWPLGRR